MKVSFDNPVEVFVNILIFPKSLLGDRDIVVDVVCR